MRKKMILWRRWIYAVLPQEPFKASVRMSELQPDLDWFDEEEELKWSWTYLMLCILLPSFNGFINGYSWSGLALHYVDMDWPVSRVGWPCLIGFTGRLIFQQVQMRCGFWIAVPIALIHLTAAILGLVYTTEEWAVWLEISIMQALDLSITVEGLAFDRFGLSEEMARQASSTVLVVFTIAVAASVTIGGIIYDLSGWKGMSTFHVTCQSMVMLFLLTQPVIYESFREVCLKTRMKSKESTDEEDVPAHSVVPTQPSTLPCMDESDFQIEHLDLPGTVKDDGTIAVQVEESPTEEKHHKTSVVSSEPCEAGKGGRGTQQSTGTSKEKRMSNQTWMSHVSAHTCRTALTARSGRTGATKLHWCHGSHVNHGSHKSERFRWLPIPLWC